MPKASVIWQSPNHVFYVMESQSFNSTPPPSRLHPAQIQGKEEYVRDTFREEAGSVMHRWTIKPQSSRKSSISISSNSSSSAPIAAQRVHVDESSWILLTSGSSNSSSSRFHEDFSDLMLEMCALLGGIAAFKWDASPPGFWCCAHPPFIWVMN